MIYILAVVGVGVRIFINSYMLTGIMESIADLLIQWFKLFQGMAIFILFNNLIPEEKWKKVNKQVKNTVYLFSNYTFEIYIVHEFFTCYMFTQFLPDNKTLQIFMTWVCIALATMLLIKLENIFEMMRKN